MLLTIFISEPQSLNYGIFLANPMTLDGPSISLLKALLVICRQSLKGKLAMFLEILSIEKLFDLIFIFTFLGPSDVFLEEPSFLKCSLPSTHADSAACGYYTCSQRPILRPKICLFFVA